MIKLRLNTDLLKHKAGAVIKLESDNDGNPLDSFWARRIKDSEIDNCVEIITEAKKSNKKRND
jgi:hypothetical protein